MRMPVAIAGAAIAALLLSGCGDKKDDGAQVAAGGEILPRSITDDMLPYDTVRSQPPLLSPADDLPDSAGSSTEAAEAGGAVVAGVAAQDAANDAAAAEAEVRPDAE